MPNKFDFLKKVPDNTLETDYLHYDNIVEAVEKIFKKLTKYDEIVTVAEMQSGKTEVMRRLVYVVNNYPKELKKIKINISVGNVYVILCASSKNLKNQLKQKIPEIAHNIFHLNDIQKFIKCTFDNEYLLSNMTDNSLVIFDECHSDAEKKGTIDKFRNVLKKFQKENDSFFHRIGFSATPYEQVIANFPMVVMKPGSDYYGISQMFDCDKCKHGDLPIIFQSKQLENKQECIELFNEIEICNYYYIFRLPGNITTNDLCISNIESQFKSAKIRFNSFIYDMYYQENINELLSTKPSNPTIIYLKDKLRMGEYLNTKYVYIVHDDTRNTYCHTTAQSLMGRCCGYGKKNDKTIIYCDLDKAQQHCQWIKNNYLIDYVPIDVKYKNKSTGMTINKCIY